MSNIIKALQSRYATKKFNPNKTVSQDKINILQEAFRLTATSFGLQPLKLIVIQNKTLQEKLISASFNQRQVADASHLLIIAIEKDYKNTLIEEHFDLEMQIRGTKPEILAPFKNYLTENFANKSPKELRQFALNQAYITLGNLMTVCAIEAIDACPMEGFSPEKYDELLDLSSKNLEAVLLLPVGYRADDDENSSRKKVRKPLDKLILEL